MQYCLIYSGTRLLSTELKLPNLPMDSVLIQYYLFTYLTLVELLVLVKFLSPAQWWIKLARAHNTVKENQRLIPQVTHPGLFRSFGAK